MVLASNPIFMVQLSHLCMTTGKNIALTRCTFVGKLMSMLFNMLTTFVIAYLPRSERPLISWLQSPSTVILQPKKIKSVTVSIVSPPICHALLRLKEAQAGIKIAGRNINNLRYADDTTFMEESEEEIKSLLMKVKEESGKVGLKLNTQKTKVMASGPITSWQIGGETMETVRDFIFLGSQITEDGDCSHEIKRCLLLGRKVMTNLDSILKSRDITLPTKDCLVKAMVFPVVMYGCMSWTIKLSAEELMLLNCGVGEDS